MLRIYDYQETDHIKLQNAFCFCCLLIYYYNKPSLTPLNKVTEAGSYSATQKRPALQGTREFINELH
jgi:hypothetical protein